LAIYFKIVIQKGINNLLT